MEVLPPDLVRSLDDRDVRDWSDALLARRLDERLNLIADVYNAVRAKAEGVNDTMRSIRRRRKIALNHHQIADPEKLRSTRERLKRRGRNQNTDNGPKT